MGIGATGFNEPVPDADGTLWVNRAGTLLNVDPQSGRTREWTLADDLAFGTGGTAAARLGGVWLIGPDAVRLFDGERFRAVIKTPADVWGVAEAPDGTLWAQTGDYGLIRWADGVWRSDPPGRPSRGASELAVDTGGRIWVANYAEPDEMGWMPRGVSVWDGTAWTTYTNDDLPVASDLPTLLAAPDGTVWAGSYWLLARFDGARWSQVELPDRRAGRWRLSAVDEGGRLWFVEEDCDPCGIQVFDGSTFTSYDTTSGLPSAQGWSSTVLAGPGYVVAATDEGLFALEDGSWGRLQAAPPGLPASWGRLDGWGQRRIAAVSRHEVWAVTEPRENASGEAGDASLVVFDGSSWNRKLLPGQAIPSQVVAAPDGSLWVAADTGPILRRDGVWTDLRGLVQSAAGGYAADGCNAVITLGPDGAVYYLGPSSRNQVVVLRPAGTTWRASVVGEPNPNPDCPTTLAVTGDGTVWNLQVGWGSFLSRLGDEGWLPATPPTDPGSELWVTSIAAGREGSLWVIAWQPSPSDDPSPQRVFEVRNLRWIDRGAVEGLDANDLTVLADGSLVMAGTGLAVWRGAEWQFLLRGIGMQQVSIAPDGSVWALGESLYRLPMRLP